MVRKPRCNLLGLLCGDATKAGSKDKPQSVGSRRNRSQRILDRCSTANFDPCWHKSCQGKGRNLVNCSPPGGRAGRKLRKGTSLFKELPQLLSGIAGAHQGLANQKGVIAVIMQLADLTPTRNSALGNPQNIVWHVG